MFKEQSFLVQTENPRSPESFPDIQEALKRAHKFVFDYAIDPNAFKRSMGGAYEDAAVENDMKYVRSMRKQMKEQNLTAGNVGLKMRLEMFMNIGKIFEAIVLHNAGYNGWLGENANIIVPADYDDIVNGIDGIVEFEGEKNSYSYLATAMDMTTSIGLDEKIRRVVGDINGGHLSSIRYFHSGRQGFYGQKRNVPRVVIGADKQTIRDLMVLWNGTEQPNNLMDNRGMSKHSMQIQVLDEMNLQLTAFSRYARSKGKGNLAYIYDGDLEKVKEIIKIKEEEFGLEQIRKMRLEVERDEVFQKIVQVVGRM